MPIRLADLQNEVALRPGAGMRADEQGGGSFFFPASQAWKKSSLAKRPPQDAEAAPEWVPLGTEVATVIALQRLFGSLSAWGDQRGATIAQASCNNMLSVNWRQGRAGLMAIRVEVTFMAERRLSSGDSWVRWILNECESSSIPYALRYFEPQKKRLLSLLQSSKIEDCELTLDLRGGRDAQGWHMHAMLTLPTGMIVSQGSEETLLGTMDRTLNELTGNLKKHVRQTTASLVTPANVRQEFLQPSHKSRIGLASAAVG